MGIQIPQKSQWGSSKGNWTTYGLAPLYVD